jgi:murein DD-endopeptidase MepM/ murein hydrolase activator NlpD
MQLKYIEMKKEQKRTIESLKSKHKLYKSNLQVIINNQHKISTILSKLSIVKKKTIVKTKPFSMDKKERLETKDVTQRITNKSKRSLKLALTTMNSSPRNIKTTKYFGDKTIAPLKSYDVVKKFGKCYDEIYKMELFNKSVSLQTKKDNAKVMNILKGQVVYAKESTGLLRNVVIVKHDNKIHTIYSHLDKISPTIKIGKWILKGYVVGRVSGALVFQATKNSKYIDPMELFQ